MDNLIREKLLAIVHNSRVHDKFAAYKLLLSDLNWNDYGYYTYFFGYCNTFFIKNRKFYIFVGF